MSALNHAVQPASQSCPSERSAPEASDLKRWTVLYLVGIVGRFLSIAV